VLVFALGLLGWGIYLMGVDRADRAIFAAGCVCVIAVLLVWFLTINLRAGGDQVQARLEALLGPVGERLQQLSVLLNLVSEQQLISERAKAIAFRESERDAVRRAIREDMARKDYDAALMLANEIESVFGYKQEADQFRAEIQALRQAGIRRELDAGLLAIDNHCRGEQWTQAMREAERLAGLYSGDAQASRLPQDVENRRQAHKRQLLESWQAAVLRHDIDASIEILRQLDLYLTPQEAQAMQEPARQVFKDKLLLLGQQFTLAVKEHRWAEAIRVGETIGTEFPNSRMALEVREKMDLLRQRAAEHEPVRLA
jgi:hypothetical protein